MNPHQSHLTMRALALAILVLAVAIPIGLCVLLASSFADSVSGGADTIRQEIQAAEVEVQRGAIYAANYRRLQQAYASLPYLLAGKSPTAALASLQQEVQSLVEENSGSIDSAEAVPPEDVGGLKRITIRYSMSLPATSLPAFVAGLEAHVPFLIADDLRVSTADGNTGSALTIEVNVSGFCKVKG